MSKRYLGLHGPAGVGKSTIGDLLVSLSGGEWEVFSFAKKLKQTCSAVFELSYEMFEDQDLKNKPLVPIPIDLYINKIEQVLNLQGMPNLSLIAHTPRQILQYVGTNYVRSINEAFWVSSAISSARESGKNAVFTDVRFPDEFAAIQKAGGDVVALFRDGIVFANDHPSSQDYSDLADLKVTIKNDLKFAEEWVLQYLNNHKN